MNTGVLWWSKLVNSVRFLDDIKTALLEGQSVVMNFADSIPWYDDMTEALEQKLSVLTDTRSIIYEDVSSNTVDPGEFLFTRYFSETERRKYWPDKSYEQFMAENDNTILNHRILCITGMSCGNAEAWLKTIAEYLEYRNSEERCIFIIIAQQANINESKLIRNIRYADYVSDYDCLMLCLTMLSSTKCSSIQKQYISEIASNIAHNNVEFAGLLAKEGLNLAMDPYGTASEVFRNNDIIINDLSDVVKAAVWEAQIKLVFPRLENFRRGLIQKYKEKIQSYLPIKSSNGECVDMASEVEIGQLYFICKQEKIVDNGEFDILHKMRDARNLLAHMDVLRYGDLLELGII